jgi:hypothetical protein
VQRYAFSEEAINQAWQDMEDDKKCDQPIIVVCETVQAKEAL